MIFRLSQKLEAKIKAGLRTILVFMEDDGQAFAYERFIAPSPAIAKDEEGGHGRPKDAFKSDLK